MGQICIDGWKQSDQIINSLNKMRNKNSCDNYKIDLYKY